MVNARNKKYLNFQRICSLASIPTEHFASMIERSGDSEVDLKCHNRNTGMSFRLKTISMNARGEYLIELYEIYDGSNAGTQKMIFRDWVRTSKPARRRSAGITAVMGTVILMAVAAVGAAAFYTVTIEHASREDGFLEVESFGAIGFDNSAKIVVDLDIMTNAELPLTIGGDVNGFILNEANGATSDKHRRGTLVSYEGLMEMPPENKDKELITVDIASPDGMRIFHVVEVDR